MINLKELDEFAITQLSQFNVELDEKKALDFLLHELREEQKLRQRPAGILPIKQKSGAHASASNKDEVKIETYGLYDPKNAEDSETKQRLVKLLDGQFTGQSDIIQLNPHEKLM